jgi:hypothetical protein
MPNIDRYCDLLRVPAAEVLTFRSGQLVELTVGGSGRPASKGPATAPQIMALLQEILPPDFKQQAEQKATDFPYATAAGNFRIRVRIEAGAVTAQLFVSAGAPAAAPSAVVPAAVPMADSHAPAAPVGDLGAPKHMNELFEQMLAMKASDLHLKSTKVPMIRVHGDMAFMPGRSPIPADDLYALLRGIMP